MLERWSGSTGIGEGVCMRIVMSVMPGGGVGGGGIARSREDGLISEGDSAPSSLSERIGVGLITAGGCETGSAGWIGEGV